MGGENSTETLKYSVEISYHIFIPTSKEFYSLTLNPNLPLMIAFSLTRSVVGSAINFDN